MCGRGSLQIPGRLDGYFFPESVMKFYWSWGSSAAYAGRLRTSGHRLKGHLLLNFEVVNMLELRTRYCHPKLSPEDSHGLLVKAKVGARKRTTTTTAAPPLGRYRRANMPINEGYCSALRKLYLSIPPDPKLRPTRPYSNQIANFVSLSGSLPASAGREVGAG